MSFHAPQEAARILAEGIDYAHQGELAVARDAKLTTLACRNWRTARAASGDGGGRDLNSALR